MSENIILSLQITAIGMGIVFGAIILLSVMMSLLTRFTADKETASDSAEAGPVTITPIPSSSVIGEHRAHAAAVAVVMALAELKQSQAFSEPQTALVSAWQLGMRTRQLYQKGLPLARKTQKAGQE